MAKSSEENMPVSFSYGALNSPHFTELVATGLKLVEDTATYLDGLGRRESALLESGVKLQYSKESMILTTRLMQVASWLLLMRSVKEGDYTQSQADHERAKISLVGTVSRRDGLHELPPALQALIARTDRVVAKMVMFDPALRGVEQAGNELEGIDRYDALGQQNFLKRYYSSE